MGTAHFPTVAAARQDFKQALDVAASGSVATITRHEQTLALVEGGRLRTALMALCPADAEIVAEAGGWSVTLPGLPIAADGDTLDAALDDLVLALREYAQDWTDHLRLAPNHARNWGVVQLVELSTDDELRDWVTAAS